MLQNAPQLIACRHFTRPDHCPDSFLPRAPKCSCHRRKERTANGDAESVPVLVREGDEDKGRKGRSAEDEAELLEAKERGEEGAFKALADLDAAQAVEELNGDVLAITNGSSTGNKQGKVKWRQREGRSRSPKREEQ